MNSPTDIKQAISQRKIREKVLEDELGKLRREIETLSNAAGILGVSTAPEVLDFDDFSEEKPAPVPGDITEAARRYGFVKDAFKKALGIVPPQRFCVNDVAEQIIKLLPDFNLASNKANLSSYLKEFADSGAIELIEQGRGRTPSFYRLKK